MTKLKIRPPEECVYVDIETNGILLEEITEFHAMSITLGHGRSLRYSTLPGDQPISDGIKRLEDLVTSKGYTPVFHNGAGYDLAVIHKFYPSSKDWLRVDNTIDSFLLGCIFIPDRNGGHSLDAWGEAFGIPKVQNEDWSVCTPHMVNRCVVDTQITKEVYEYLYDFMTTYGFPHSTLEGPLLLEQQVSHIHQKQHNYGVHYNLLTAMKNKTTADQEIDRLSRLILKNTPWKCRITGVPLKHQEAEKLSQYPQKTVKPFKKDGNYTVNACNFWGEDIHQVKGEYTKVEFHPLNLSNPEEVKDFLLTLGWIPTEWNYKFENGRKLRTSPKLTEESFHTLPEGLGKQIANYRTYLHRSRSIMNVDYEAGKTKGAVSHLRADSRVSAEALTCGTPTARYRHMKAVCNIPRPSSLFGKEIRETFGVPEGCTQLGFDLAGIESRMLAHELLKYVDKSHPLIQAILADKDKGKVDFHTRNAGIWKVSRDLAKNGLYALTTN